MGPATDRGTFKHNRDALATYPEVPLAPASVVRDGPPLNDPACHRCTKNLPRRVLHCHCPAGLRRSSAVQLQTPAACSRSDDRSPSENLTAQKTSLALASERSAGQSCGQILPALEEQQQDSAREERVYRRRKRGRGGAGGKVQLAQNESRRENEDSLNVVVDRHDCYRHLIGGYVDWDDTLLKMRVLDAKLG